MKLEFIIEQAECPKPEVEKDWTTKAGLRAVCVWYDGHRCGYVEVPEGHLLFDVEYGDDVQGLRTLWEQAKEGEIGKRGIISMVCNTDDEARPDCVFDVHGGLTHSGTGKNGYPVKSEGWWFGFDCAHSGDKTKGSSEGVERSKSYVVSECESLAEQLAAVANPE